MSFQARKSMHLLRKMKCDTDFAIRSIAALRRQNSLLIEFVNRQFFDKPDVVRRNLAATDFAELR